jgi:hypothetical protein
VVRVKPKLGRRKPKNLLQKLNRTENGLPTLYDLVLINQSSCREQINYHAVQFVETFHQGCYFVHLTDLHLARRNDDILAEVLSDKTDREPSEIREKYINFNKHFREFVKAANKMREDRELHFVVITGDIVDFAFCGWEPDGNEAENNWKTFIEIVLGEPEPLGSEISPGIRVAIFTSTGNHDWRTWPYDPHEWKRYRTYGLEENEMKNCRFSSFDAVRHGKKREKLEAEMMRDVTKRYNLGAFTTFPSRVAPPRLPGFMYLVLPAIWTVLLKLPQWVANTLQSWFLVALTAFTGWVGLSLPQRLETIGLAAVPTGLRLLAEICMRCAIRYVVDFPIYADSMALQYYLKYVNPYLDYAFKWGKHSFIVMDSGSDVFTGSFLDEKDLSDIKRMSVEDNILGGSPDSRGFDSSHLYYNWSQIVWLENVLAAIKQQEEEDEPGRTVIFVHAPPLNVEYSKQWVMRSLWESSRNNRQERRIPKKEYDLTYGTLNHYVGQFLFLCLGYPPSHEFHPDEQDEPTYNAVDIVFSGHAHRNIEFRLEIGGDEGIRIYSDKYNELLSPPSPGPVPPKPNGPFVVQTAACGVKEEDWPNPPYFRMVTLDQRVGLTGFEIRSVCRETSGWRREVFGDAGSRCFLSLCLDRWFKSGKGVWSRIRMRWRSIVRWLLNLPEAIEVYIGSLVYPLIHGLQDCKIGSWIILILLIALLVAVVVLIIWRVAVFGEIV